MKDARIYLDHILECIEKIQVDYFGGLRNPKDLFERDDKTKQATLHRLQTLGQAVKNLPDEVRLRIASDVKWKQIAGFRDVLVHDYLGLDLDIVWNVVEKELPVLDKAIRNYLEKT